MNALCLLAENDIIIREVTHKTSRWQSENKIFLANAGQISDALRYIQYTYIVGKYKIYLYEL